MYNKSIILVLLLSVIVFLIALYALLMQTFGIFGVDSSTIISGILSMVGGFGGAFGAYFVASHQMKEQFEYDKRKEEKKSKKQSLQTLKKLEILNLDTIDFIRCFELEFNEPYIDEIDVKLKIREYDLQYIVNKVDKINDEILWNGYNVDFLRFSRELNNIYIEIIGFTLIPEKHRSFSLIALTQSVKSKNEIFKSFDTYVKDHIHEIQLELISLERLNP